MKPSRESFISVVLRPICPDCLTSFVKVLLMVTKIVLLFLQITKVGWLVLLAVDR